MNLTSLTKEFNYNWKLAYPVVLGMLGHTLVQFFDNVMVGQLGTAELAAVSLGNSFFFVALSLALGFSTAITPLVAEGDAAGDHKQISQTYKHGMLLCTILGMILAALLILTIPLMDKMGQSPEVVVHAKPYLIWVAISLIPLAMFQALKQFADGMSITKYPMYATIVANVINVMLNYLLIFGKFGLPEMGIVGAALGTFISRIVGLIFLWLTIYRDPKLTDYINRWDYMDIKGKVVNKLLALGIPSAMQTFFEVLIFTAAIWLSGILGKNPQAANQIALNLATMSFMVATGLSVAATIRVGNQKGLKRFKDLRRIAFSIVLMTLLIEFAFGLFFFIARDILPTIYLDLSDPINKIDNMEVTLLASKLLVIAALFQVSDGIQVCFLGALRGMQDVIIPTYITMFAYWIIAFPLCYYLGLKTNLGSVGIWIGLLVGLTVSALLLFYRFYRLSNQLIYSSAE